MYAPRRLGIHAELVRGRSAARRAVRRHSCAPLDDSGVEGPPRYRQPQSDGAASERKAVFSINADVATPLAMSTLCVGSLRRKDIDQVGRLRWQSATKKEFGRWSRVLAHRPL